MKNQGGKKQNKTKNKRKQIEKQNEKRYKLKTWVSWFNFLYPWFDRPISIFWG